MRNNIFVKLTSIILLVFGTYLFLLFLYDFYFYKKYYLKVCSKIYCFDHIEFKDYASILATLIGSAFVAYSLFSWADNFKYNLKKGDIDRFRQVIHNLMKTLTIIHGDYSDISSYIEVCETSGRDASSFENMIVNFKGNLTALTDLAMKADQQFHEFTFESRYFILHGGNLDLINLKDKRKKLYTIIGFMLADLHRDNVTDFKLHANKFETLYKEFNSELLNILDKTYESLLS
ncbi:hypothetical protein [Acinetobacter baumannii]|uniref:hypothetical protein n=1 Tax=Acinetobacter baumannii TaxID=470 RepID=UPI002340E463|nr:hypothetical protein [Acinetobacter baumannii]MDC4539500.1 hypothetical protein [Acinetobacter baumannii]MDK2223159.1 hypothetical protein [Acinetobacter baumannii]MDK2234014.1 hypothetical protein [Acinetobacter baumannii]HCA5024665.1 hypothetical protein [Acinetobacter baumannii]